MQRRWASTAVKALVAGALLVLTVPSVTAAADPTGEIRGRITDSAGDPVGSRSGICARVGLAGGVAFDLDDDGNYRLWNVPVGTWAVRFIYCESKRDDSPTYAPEFYPGLRDPMAADSPLLPNITVTAGAVISGIDAQLAVGGSLSVDIEDADGTPRAGLCAIASPVEEPTSAGVEVGVLTPVSHSGTTDANGTVTFEGMSPGDYTVIGRVCSDAPGIPEPDIARHQYLGNVIDRSLATAVEVDVAEHVAGGTITMPTAARVSGTVTVGGEPVANSCVTWDLRSGWHELLALTDAAGNYTIGGITPGEPGVVRACPDITSPAEYFYRDTTEAPLWYPQAASRWTADEVTLAPGQVMGWNAELRPRGTHTAVVTSLPSADGCVIRVNDDGASAAWAPLRASRAAGVWVADVFGIDGRTGLVVLECDGVPIGAGRRVSTSTPLVQLGWTENEHSPVSHVEPDEMGPTITPWGVPTTWTNKPTLVTFVCADVHSEVRSCPPASTFSEGQRRTVTAEDLFGNAATLTLGPLKIDQTPPRISLATTRRTFGLAETLRLGCNVTDTRSGLRTRSISCPPDGTSARSLGTGDHRFHVIGVDHAGNSVGAWVDITIVK